MTVKTTKCKCGNDKTVVAKHCFACHCGGGACDECGGRKRSGKSLCRKCDERRIKQLQVCKCGNKKTQHADVCQKCKTTCECGKAKNVRSSKCSTCFLRSGEIKCVVCGKVFLSSGSLKGRKTCSDDCKRDLCVVLANNAAKKAGELNRQRASIGRQRKLAISADRTALKIGPCVACGCTHKRGRKDLCSQCFQKITKWAQRLNNQKTCVECGLVFDNRVSQSLLYCSRGCYLVSCSARESRRTQRSNRRHKIRCVDGQATSRVVSSEIFKRDNNLCVYCGIEVRVYKRNGWMSDDEATMDHVVPISIGGEHTEQNIVTACRKCNTAKSDVFYIDDCMANQYNVVKENKTKKRRKTG